MEKENEDRKKNGKDQDESDLPDLDKGHPFYGKERRKPMDERETDEGKNKKDQKKTPVKAKKTKTVDKGTAEKPFREGSARA